MSSNSKKRTEMACKNCRKRKIKCNSLNPDPCDSCRSKQQICVYLSVEADRLQDQGTPPATLPTHYPTFNPSPTPSSPRSPVTHYPPSGLPISGAPGAHLVPTIQPTLQGFNPIVQGRQGIRRQGDSASPTEMLSHQPYTTPHFAEHLSIPPPENSRIEFGTSPAFSQNPGQGLHYSQSVSYPQPIPGPSPLYDGVQWPASQAIPRSAGPSYHTYPHAPSNPTVGTSTLSSHLDFGQTADFSQGGDEGE